MKKVVLFVVALLLSFSVADAKQSDGSAFDLVDIYAKHHEIKITDDQNGIVVKGEEGKVVLVEFFGHNCPPCLMSIPHLINLQKKYSKGLFILAIEVQGMGGEMLKEFAKKRDINYAVMEENEQNSAFVEYLAKKAQWGGSIPFMLLFDHTGEVKLVHTGMLPQSIIDKYIVKYMKKSNTTTKQVKNKDANKSTKAKK